MMWTRKALKEQAKEALRRNYWKIVLVSSLLLFLGGGVSFTGVGSSNREVISQDAEDVEDIEDIEEDISGKENYFVKIDTEQGEVHWGAKERNMPSGVWIIATIIGVIIFISIFLFILVLIFLVDIFLWNPFSVGVERFMLKSVDDQAQVKEIGYAFDHSYKNIVRTLFHRDLQILLWALLLFIPGVYKKYQYRMVSYIMAEYPDMEYRRALQLSKDMMNGHKWNAFVLDLSFILWHFLGTITCGIVEIFYVQPYQQLTNAALYRRLSGFQGSDRQAYGGPVE